MAVNEISLPIIRAAHTHTEAIGQLIMEMTFVSMLIKYIGKVSSASRSISMDEKEGFR